MLYWATHPTDDPCKVDKGVAKIIENNRIKKEYDIYKREIEIEYAIHEKKLEEGNEALC